jgi:hypothetical protein
MNLKQHLKSWNGKEIQKTIKDGKKEKQEPVELRDILLKYLQSSQHMQLNAKELRTAYTAGFKMFDGKELTRDEKNLLIKLATLNTVYTPSGKEGAYIGQPLYNLEVSEQIKEILCA